MSFPSDIEISSKAVMKPITEIAAELGIRDEELEQYGRYKAKINDNFIKRNADRKDGKLVLVTAINVIESEGFLYFAFACAISSEIRR